MQDSLWHLDEGRAVAYTDMGRPGWPCVFFFHGAPMSRLHLAYLEQEFIAAQVRVLSPDRPAYGGSTPRPGRVLEDWPADVAAFADALGIDRFMVAGHSTGGAYAAVCAARLPSRVLAGIILAGVTDMGWPGAWEGYPDSERQIMRLPDEDAAVTWCVERYGADGAGFFTAADFEFGAVDETFMGDQRVGAAIGAGVREAFRQGVAGYAQDVFVQGRPWGFHPSDTAVPVHVVHGGLDALLPVAHSGHTAALIPGSTLRVLPGHGHMTILSELPGTAAALAEHGR